MKFLYTIFISLMIFGMKIGALFSYKLKRGLAGRRQSCEIVQRIFSKNDKVIWMHAASLGEYEQGLPVLEKLKEQFPSHKILITFFSPSGYENVVKKNHIADAVCYLPFDLKHWVKDFMKNFKTEIFFTVKYDYWYHLLEELKNQNAKVYAISSLFYENQIFFQPFGGWFSKQLKKNVNWFFHQTKNSYALAKTIGFHQSSIAGDTRFDRVKQIRNRNNAVDFIGAFKSNKKLIVFGSSWQKEEEIALILSKKSRKAKIIIAPHDLKRIEQLKEIFPNATLFSSLNHLPIHEKEKTAISLCEQSQILIIDCIGLLSKIYSYADLAVVGGGFHSKGLHNILEAATFGIPVFFGNQYRKNPEADDLINLNGGKSFNDERDASGFILNLLRNEEKLHKMGANAKHFVDQAPNSTEIILDKIRKDFN